MKETIALFLVVASLGAAPTFAGERRLKRSDVPQAVLDTIAQRYPKARHAGYALEHDNGRTAYEVELVNAGRRTDVSLSPEGAVLVEEQRVSVKELPDEVRRGLAASHYGKARVLRAERVVETSKSAPTYELVVFQRGGRREITFDAEGTLTGDEGAGED
jgi:hypothetical protein